MDPETRDAVAREIRVALASSCPGSRVELRGSLADGTADVYSDIDLAWTVPDERFGTAVASVPEVLGGLRPLESVRSDPDLRHSAKRRLLFVLFRDLPLFWRLDLEIWAASAEGDTTDEPGAADATGWSPHASALANAVAAIKAVRRGRFDDARGLVDRGFERIGSRDRASGDWAADITRLAEQAAAPEAAAPEAGDLSRRVRELVAELL
jgi:predicted nucleotidyltransferase